MTDMQTHDDGGFSVRTSDWPELDTSLLEDARNPVPAFPLEHLPSQWRQWVEDTAQSAGAPVDYVVQGLFAAVAALCGAGVRVRIMQAWSESLVLWLALVGSPSSGKSPALASVRDRLGEIETRMRDGDDDRRGKHAAKLEEARMATDRWRDECETAGKEGLPAPQRPSEAGFDQPFVPSQIVVADATMEALADVVSGNPRGVILWRDELTAWLANLGRYSGGTDRAHWLEAWAAAGITVNRRSRPQPLHLPNRAAQFRRRFRSRQLADGPRQLRQRFTACLDALVIRSPQRTTLRNHPGPHRRQQRRWNHRGLFPRVHAAPEVHSSTPEISRR